LLNEFSKSLANPIRFGKLVSCPKDKLMNPKINIKTKFILLLITEH
jgi:hypothetical protein